MNNRMIVYMIGRMLGVEGLLLLVPALVSFLYGEQSGIAFLLTAAILLIIFLLAGRKKPKDTSIYGKEGLALVGIAWILWFTVRCTAVFYLRFDSRLSGCLFCRQSPDLQQQVLQF